MTTAAYFIVIMTCATALYFGFRWLVLASSRYRGNRTVRCPETAGPAIVEVDALHASLTGIAGRPDIYRPWRYSISRDAGSLPA